MAVPPMSDSGPPDLEQMHQILNMTAPGAGFGGMMPPAAPPGGFVSFPPASPDSVQAAYLQMLQYLQGIGAAGIGAAGMPPPPAPPLPAVAAGLGMPPAPFPGMLPPYGATVNVTVEGMKFAYQLTEDDIHKVFCRYGEVASVAVDEACSSAKVTFRTLQDAQAAISDLDGKVLNGLDGTLRIQWVSPTPGYPGWPPFGMDLSQIPPWALGGAPPGGNGAPPGFPGGAMAVPHAMAGGCGGGCGDFSDGKGEAKTAHVKGARKYTCRFLIGIENDKEFQVARRLIGSKGSNMKRIVQQTDAKLRLRGQGSGYFEGSGQKESTEPLQLCISCMTLEGYKTAVRQVEELLKRIHEEYRQYCRDMGVAVPDLQINLSESHLIYSPRGAGGAQGGAASGKKERGNGRGGARRGGGKAPGDGTGEVDRGKPGPHAPPVEEIKRLIQERNEARRACNFAEADRIRDQLHGAGVALMDEPGARGKGSDVTTWRYWHS